MPKDRQTMQDFVRKHSVTMTCVKTDRNPYMEASGGGREMDHWRCTLYCTGRRVTITFSMGSGHSGKQPEIWDVLNAMASDATSVENSSGWEDFARDMGMDVYVEDDYGRRKPNSKAKKSYNACWKENEQLKKLLGDEAAEELKYQTECL